MQTLESPIAISHAPEVPEPWVDNKVVAQHLSYRSPLTITRMAEKGIIPGIHRQSGKRTYWRFKLSAVDAALTASQNGDQNGR